MQLKASELGFKKNSMLSSKPRTLDAELRGIIKVKDVNFDVEKLGFVLEAKGDMQQSFLVKGQSHISNALKAAERSALDLFMTQLDTDQTHFRSYPASVITYQS